MKKLVWLSLLLIILVSTLAGCKHHYYLPYRLEWQASEAKGEVQVSTFTPRETYYCEENGVHGADIRMVDAAGQDLLNPTWSPVDPFYGELAPGPAPNTRKFWPKRRGNVVVEAEQDGYVARTTVIVLPHESVTKGTSLDIDNDGEADFVSMSDGFNFQFPFGATVTNILCIPELMGEIPSDYPAPPTEPLLVENPNGNPKVCVLRSSTGIIYAAMVSGMNGQVVCWRKLRDAS